MNKQLALLSFLLVLLIGGCNATKDTVDVAAKNVFEHYKRCQINVDNCREISDKNFLEYVQSINEKCKPYLTEQGYQRFVANRLGSYSVEAARSKACNIQVVKIQYHNQTQEDDKLTFDYVVDIKISYPDNERSDKVLSKKGKATMVRQGDNWKVQNDWKGFIIPWKDISER